MQIVQSRADKRDRRDFAWGPRAVPSRLRNLLESGDGMVVQSPSYCNVRTYKLSNAELDVMTVKELQALSDKIDTTIRATCEGKMARSADARS